MRHHAIIALCTCLLLACEKPVTTLSADENQTRPVKTIKIAAQSATQVQRFPAIVRADRVADIAFDIGGRLTSLAVKEGQSIQKGASIAQLDLETSALQLREAKVQLGIAQRRLRRAETLFTERSLSQSDIEDARAALALREIAVEKAEEHLADRQLIAPFSGEIARRYVDEHSQLRAGQSVIRLQDLTHLRLEASIPAQLVATHEVQDVEAMFAEFDFLPGQQFALALYEHHGESSTTAQTFSADFRMPAPTNSKIRPGMTASVNLRFKQAAQHIYNLPLGAIRSDNEKDFIVWRVDPSDSTVSAVPIELVAINGAQASVRSDALAGQTIVSNGASQLHAGQTIRRMESSNHE